MCSTFFHRRTSWKRQSTSNVGFGSWCVARNFFGPFRNLEVSRKGRRSVPEEKKKIDPVEFCLRLAEQAAAKGNLARAEEHFAKAVYFEDKAKSK